MPKHQRFKYKTHDELLNKANELGLELPFQESIDPLFEEVAIGTKKVVNRFVVQPMEGFDSDSNGAPTELTFRRYKRFASGGSGLLWFEATSVVPEGRSNRRQLYINSQNADVFARLVAETRRAAFQQFGASYEVMLVLQLTHSGRYSKSAGKPTPIITHHSAVLDSLYNLPSDYPLIGDDELDKLQESYVNAARLAAKAGFDGVDVKACHCYLVSELLASFTRENSKYGGSFENRTRFLLETTQKIREQVPGIFVTSRLNVYDAMPYPFGFGVEKNDATKEDLSESISLIRVLQDTGLPALNISIGNPYYNPHIGRPYDLPIAGGQTPSEHPLCGVVRLLNITGKLQQMFPDLPIVGTGYSWLRQYFPNVGAAIITAGKATLVGQGRGAFAYPDSVIDLANNGKMDPHKVCITCSACTQIMRDGGKTGCVIRDKEIYGREYRKVRTNVLRMIK
ncbi:hypothetical protein JW960_18215 [candidate division KSB1 bacterium]|nr:hypothetical protein [candidate division KSB1 bacterium]